MSAISAILAPTDLTLASVRAIDLAHALAQRFGAAWHTLYVASPVDIAPDVAIGAPNLLPPIVASENVMESARRHLDRFLQFHPQWNSGGVQRHVAVGGIVPEILACAKRHHVDLIIMGTRTHGLAQRLFRGSLSETLLERAECPVLLVPHRDSAIV